MKLRLLGGFAAMSAMALFSAGASAATIYWTDWTGVDTASGSAFQGHGTITTGTETVNVTYDNPQGIGFYQTAGGAYYWSGGSDGAAGTSPYTSSAVDNRPNTTDIIGLRWAGNQTLTFSKTVANLVFSYVSLNGNGYAFDQDFDLLGLQEVVWVQTGV